MSFSLANVISKEVAAASINTKKLSDLENTIADGEASPLQIASYQACQKLIKNFPVPGVFSYHPDVREVSLIFGKMARFLTMLKANSFEQQHKAKSLSDNLIFEGLYNKIVGAETSNGTDIVSTEDIQRALTSFIADFSIDFSGEDKITEEGLVESWYFLSKQPTEKLGEMLFEYRRGMQDLPLQEKTKALILFILMLGYRGIIFKGIRIGDHEQGFYSASMFVGVPYFTIRPEAKDPELKKKDNIFNRYVSPLQQQSFSKQESYEFHCDEVYEGLKHVEESPNFNVFQSKVAKFESLRTNLCYSGLFNVAIENILNIDNVGSIENGNHPPTSTELQNKLEKLYSGNSNQPQPQAAFPGVPMPLMH